MTIQIDVYHHFEPSPGHSDVLTEILTRVRVLEQIGVQLMSAADDMQTKLDEIDTATNNIAADIQNLKDQITTSMSAADVLAVQARLDSTAVALQAIAASTPEP